MFPANPGIKLDTIEDGVDTVTADLFKVKGQATSEIVKRTCAEIRANDVLGRAAQIAYYFFLALFPFLICVIASLSVFGTADRGRALLFDLLGRFLPAPAFQLIRATFSEILLASGPLKMSFGIIFSLWSASMGMSAVMDTLNAAYKVVETRSFVKQYVVAIGLTLGIATMLVLSVLTVILGDSIAGALSSLSFVAHTWKIIKWTLGLVLLLFAFGVMFNLGPDLRRQWRWITPGAVVSIFLLIAVSAGMRIYLRHSTYNAEYGSLGAVIVLLLFFYMSGVAVLSGGVLNGVLESRLALEAESPEQ
jgi:membrane protein